nr:lipoprotein insertase outer membrane protein LolB [Parahaliea mediterranea]
MALLTACATTPAPQGADTPWEERARDLRQLAHWQAEGKLALRNDEQAESATLLWRQAGRDTELQLSGPLGMAATRIHSDGQTLEIQRDGDFQVIDISTPRAVRLNTGWDLPLASLPYWMKGVPYPGTEPEAMAVEQHLLRSLEQDGWRVSFEAYGQFGRYTLPTRLRVERGGTRAKLVIRQWQTGEPG